MKQVAAITFMIAIVALVCLEAAATRAQSSRHYSQDAPEFKVPDGYMPAPLSGFRGMMLLDPKKAAGMFVSYPDENESTDALSQRLLKFIGPMFIHKEEGKPEPAISWTARPMPTHPGDRKGVASTNAAVVANQELQVVLYEWATGTRPFVYGYFGMRHTPAKENDAKFIDEQGQGVKAFDKLWQSFTK